MAMRKFAWIPGIAGLLVCLAVAYAAYLLADYSWNQVVEYESPYVSPHFPAEKRVAAPGEPSAVASETPRVVFVLIDGLTVDASRQNMTALNTVRQYGADMIAVVPQPSLSYPTWTNTVSGAPQDISGVTTNWFEGRVPVETLFDAVATEGHRVVVSATEDFDELYGVNEVAYDTYLEPWDDSIYHGQSLVDQALRMAEQSQPTLTFVYIPDADHVAHENGPESQEYAEMIALIDRDLSRLIDGMQDERTMFVVTADHGHIDGGGHGGWESAATQVPAVFFGPGTKFESSTMSQSDIAPTVSMFLGVSPPAYSAGHAHPELVTIPAEKMPIAERQYRLLGDQVSRTLEDATLDLGATPTYAEVDAALADVRARRLQQDRADRLPLALAVAGAALFALVLIGLFSWRALVSVLAGVLAYNVVYNGLYFVVHGHEWSLSAFNTESYIQTFFNIRMLEAAAAGLGAVLVAAIVYPLLRKNPKGPQGQYLGGWLSLGPATVLAIQATLGLQVAWFLWAWGAQITWRLPDLRWGFKYDLDLIQTAALGATALLAPVVTFLVGRYHPKVRRALAASAQRAARRAQESPGPIVR